MTLLGYVWEAAAVGIIAWCVIATIVEQRKRHAANERIRRLGEWR